MSTPFDLHTIDLLVSLSHRAAEEIWFNCQDQRLRLYNQRQTLLANRKKRLAREARQNQELRELYSSLGLVKPVD
jgi:hypothetical protein